MTHHAFQLLSPVEQLYWVLKHGTCLAQCWEAADTIKLYHCADGGRGFFAEVGVNDGKGYAVLLRSFVSTDLLEKYGHDMLLPQEWA